MRDGMRVGRGLLVSGGGGVLLASIVSTQMYWTLLSVVIIAATVVFLVVLVARYLIQRSRPRRLGELGNALNGKIALDRHAALAGGPRMWAVYAVGREFHHGVYPAKGEELLRLMPERHSQIVQVAVFPDTSRARSAAARMLRAGFSSDELRSLLPNKFAPCTCLPEAGTTEPSQPIGTDATQPIVEAPSMNNPRDTTQYWFDGAIRGKGPTVLAVVTRHVREHPQITFAELRAAFPDSLQASSPTQFSAVQAVVELLDSLREPGHKRFFMKPEEMLTLPDCVVVVSREWNLFNIRTFLARAEELGYQIAIVDTPYRAFALGDGGIVENAKLFDSSHLTALIDVAAVWRLASIVVGQKYLSDIHQTLEQIQKHVSEIAHFQRDEQTSKIESDYNYLRQVECSLSHGEQEEAVRHRLESIDSDMDAIQRHLVKIFEAKLDTKIRSQNLLNYDDLGHGLLDKLDGLKRLLDEHRSAGLTRLGALQMLSMFPGGIGLRSARAAAIQDAAKQNKAMCDDLQRVMAFEVAGWTGRTESVLMNLGEVLTGESKFHKWIEGTVLPKSLRPATESKSRLRGPAGSDTPLLDKLKLASLSLIRVLAVAESESADRLLSAVPSTDRQAHKLEEPKRYLVEWGETGPTRILEIPA